MTACTAGRYGDHDYSLPPHNTPDNPRDAEAGYDPCHAVFGGCEDDRAYEVVVYQAGTHEWIRMYACVPCTAALREFHGPGSGECQDSSEGDGAVSVGWSGAVRDTGRRWHVRGRSGLAGTLLRGKVTGRRVDLPAADPLVLDVPADGLAGEPGGLHEVALPLAGPALAS